MAKLFVSSVRYPSCSYANDFDFRFCQRCEYQGQFISLLHLGLLPQVDLALIDNRLYQLWLSDQATSYVRQKDSFRKELEGFLSTL
jgi:hypothetical protein